MAVDIKLASARLKVPKEARRVQRRRDGARVRRDELLVQARRGEVVVLDVRPREEYDTAHLPFARSMPLAELAHRPPEQPRGVEIVAHCRGPFCLMSDEAVVRP